MHRSTSVSISEEAARPQQALASPRASPRQEAAPHGKLPPVPDRDNLRFCRACQATLPVAAFPSGKRRYLCRRHTWERIKQPSKQRALADPQRKCLWVIWKRCWTDAKKAFGHTRIALQQRDIAQALSGLDWSIASVVSKCVLLDTTSVLQVSGSSGAGGAESGATRDSMLVRLKRMDVQDGDSHGSRAAKSAMLHDPPVHMLPPATCAILPANPTCAVSHENLVVVDGDARRGLLRAYREGGVARYVAALAELRV
jgi:hypothetical protein